MSDRAAIELPDADEIDALYRSAPIGLCVIDRELRYVRVNDRLAEINGITAADHIGRTIHEVVPSLGEQAEAALGRVLAGEPIHGLEFTGETPAYPGVVRSWRENWVPLRNASGDVVGISIAVEEMTDARRAADALRKGEERMRFGLEAARMIMWEFDLQTGKSRRSANAKALFGLDPEGTAEFYRRVHPEDLDRLKAKQASALLGEAPYEIEFRMQGPDGRMLWVSIRGQVRRDRTGNPSMVAGVLMDVTARKEAELAAALAAAEFEALAENLSQLAWMAEPDGSITWFNRRWYDYTGGTPEEMVGLGGGGVPVHPDHLERVRARWFESFARGVSWEDVFPLRGADGQYRWFLSRAEPIHDEGGTIVRWFGTNTDVTEQIETADALARSEAQFRTMFDALPGMIFLADANGANTRVNDGFCSYTGCAPDQLLGLDWLEVLHPEDRGRGREIWEGAIKAGSVYTAEHRFRRSDGAYRWHIARGLPLRDANGEVTGWVGACMDIHERKISEEELHRRVEEAVAARETALFQLHEAQKLETVGQLTGGVAHDFNNLLTPIVGSLDLLRRRLDDDRSVRLIDGALASAERARTLIQRLLAFARRQTLKPRAVQPQVLVDGMRDLIERSLGPQIAFDAEVEPGLPSALADLNQLELALLNLSVNARDAMPNGGRLRWHVAEETVRGDRMDLAPGRYVSIAVSDTGTGMDEETLTRAVEPFFSTKPAGKGTGLGLSMVHGLAAQSGGAFRLESTPGKGTTATLWLPIAGSEDVVPVRELDARAAPRRAVVLLVDDEEQVRLTTAESLLDLGYRVVQTGSAQEALDRIAQGLSPDLLVTDHLMPGMTGAQLAIEVRRTFPMLPVLMITGYAQLRPEETGGFDVLVKPYRHAELALRIAELLSDPPMLRRASSEPAMRAAADAPGS